MIKLDWDAITGFSCFPLQVAIYISLLFGALAIVGIPVVAFLRLATGHKWFAGQATAIVLLLLIASFMFFFFVIGQYIARIYDEVRGRPLYIVADTFNVSRLANERHTRPLPLEDDGSAADPVLPKTSGDPSAS